LLIDYKKPQIAEGNLEFKSSKILCEYDCKNKTRKFLLIKMFELSMGAGSCLYHSGELNEPASELPSEGNVGYKAWEIACELNPSMNL
jgi:hypothetical protein